MGRLCRLKTVFPDCSASEILPLPAALPPNPLLISCAVMETFKVAGPALVSTDSGEMLKLTSWGGVLSAAAEPANKTEAANAHRNRKRSTSLSVDLLAELSDGCGEPECERPDGLFSGFFGAGDGIRTRDIDLGKVALYQLSYSRTP